MVILEVYVHLPPEKGVIYDHQLGDSNIRHIVAGREDDIPMLLQCARIDDHYFNNFSFNIRVMRS